MAPFMKNQQIKTRESARAERITNGERIYRKHVSWT